MSTEGTGGAAAEPMEEVAGAADDVIVLFRLPENDLFPLPKSKPARNRLICTKMCHFGRN